MSRRKKRRIKLRSTYNWHRYLGITAAAFVFLLAASGLALNHTEQLNLDKRHIQNSWLLAWYDIPTPEVMAYRIGDKWISQWGDKVFWGTHLVTNNSGLLVGAIDLVHIIAVGFQNHLLLMTPEGEHIETLGAAHGMPANINSIGLTALHQTLVRTDHGYYVSDDDFSYWADSITNNITNDNIRWSRQSPLPDPVYRQLLKEYRGNGLTLGRIILDLHSGRIFGNWGVYVMDAAAIILLFLAGSGIWIWIVRHIRYKTHRNTHNQIPTKTYKTTQTNSQTI